MKLQQSNHKICIVGVKEMGDKGEKNFVGIIAKKKMTMYTERYSISRRKIQIYI